MFVLNELDNLIRSVLPAQAPDTAGRFRLSLGDLQRINVEELELAGRVRFAPSNAAAPTPTPTPTRDYADDRRLAFRELLDGLGPVGAGATGGRPPSMGSIFLELCHRLVLAPLASLPRRHYPWAKLIICDQSSYEALRRMSRYLKPAAIGGRRHFLYRPPFNVTAILLLENVVEAFRATGKPIVVGSYDRSSGQKLLNYNYGLIRQLFPFLKMCQLTVILDEESGGGGGARKRFEPGRFSAEASVEHQILHLLSNYARQVQLIQLSPVRRILGHLHASYENVSVLPASVTGSPAAGLAKLELWQLAYVADRLVQLAALLRLHVVSVAYRAADSSGQTKVLAQLLEASLRSKGAATPAPPPTKARVIVVDRRHDLLSVLLHADCYGPFLEQELEPDQLSWPAAAAAAAASSSSSEGPARHLRGARRLPDDRDERLEAGLRALPLSRLLAGLLRQCAGAEAGAGRRAPPPASSIRRHLELVKLVYGRLADGYLLVLRLEASLEWLAGQLRAGAPAHAAQQVELAERLERALAAFRQLAARVSAGSSVAAADLARVAGVALHVCNMYLWLHGAHRKEASAEARRSVLETRAGLLALAADKELQRGPLKGKLAAYERLTRDACPERSPLSLAEILDGFRRRQLDEQLFPVLSLADDGGGGGSGESREMLVFLGRLSPLELARIKSADGDDGLCILAAGLLKPAELLASL